ncbi:MAG: SDR family oxidoreductase [Planctomycetes bacterium]|nr:SDR family oxidoreductase [Planctomycetota bacterium]
MLDGKRIVVTGAGRGIGRAIALACLREGAVVGVHYRTSEESARELERNHPGRVRLLRFDVRDPDTIAPAVSGFRESEGRIDGWVNNAGIVLPSLLMTADVDRIRALLDVNLLGPILCARAVLPIMLRQRCGVILNVGSVAAERPLPGQSVYAAAKGGVEALTRALAVEYGRKGIRVHCLRPGPVDTPMLASARALAEEAILSRTPLRRIGRPEEVAEMAVFLLGDRASFVTGSIHTIDGGYVQG